MLPSQAETALELRTGYFYLILSPRPVGRSMMNSFAARLALERPVQVLDGGNAFDALGIARQVRRFTADLDTVLGRLLVARAFTCYQMVAMLETLPSAVQAILALDLLATFCDESVDLRERMRLLERATVQLKRLSQAGPLAVNVAVEQVETDIANLLFGHLAQFGAVSPAMLAHLEETADQTLYYTYPAMPVQLKLFVF